MIWTTIKLIAGKFLKTRVGGIASSLLGGWQLYLLLGILFGGYILKLNWNVHSAKKALVKQTEKSDKEILKLQTKIELKDAELLICRDSNAAHTVAILSLEKANKECVLNNQANETATNKAITDLGNTNEKLNKKYDDLKDIKIDNVCANTIIGVELR